MSLISKGEAEGARLVFGGFRASGLGAEDRPARVHR
jgi:hypothetical protein